MSRIFGLSDLKKKDENEKEQEYFAGGLDQRGYDLVVTCLFFVIDDPMILFFFLLVAKFSNFYSGGSGQVTIQWSRSVILSRI